MHVVTRQANEGVVIGEDILVTVLEVGDDHVRLAVECPRLSPSYREHVLFRGADETWEDSFLGRELQLQ